VDGSGPYAPLCGRCRVAFPVVTCCCLSKADCQTGRAEDVPRMGRNPRAWSLPRGGHGFCAPAPDGAGARDGGGTSRVWARVPSW
jgi:hypothetical protein